MGKRIKGFNSGDVSNFRSRPGESTGNNNVACNLLSKLLFFVLCSSTTTSISTGGSGIHCYCKRRKRFPLLLLLSMSIVGGGLYYATYFQVMSVSWKAGHWFGLTPQASSSSSRGSNSSNTTNSGSNKTNRHVMIKGFLDINGNKNNKSSTWTSKGGESSSTLVEDANNALLEIEDNVGEANSEQMACKLPKLDPMDSSIIDFIKSPPDIQCTDETHPSMFRTDFHSTLIQITAFQEPVECCYKSLQRGNSSDKDIKFSRECFHIKSLEEKIPAEHEFIYIRCKNLSLNSANHTKQETIIFKDMFAFVPVKPQVEARVAMYYLENGEKEEDEDWEAEGKERRREEGAIQSLNDSSRLPSMEESQTHFRKLEEKKKEDEEEMMKKKKKNKRGKMKPRESRSPPLLEDRLNVVILGLDAQSHMNLIRQMPLSYDYLVHNLSAIGMHGYTKVSDNTFPNVVPLLTGLNVAELQSICWTQKDSHFDECPFIWKRFAAQGYRTVFGEDSVWMGTFNYNKAGFLRPPTDYYLNPFTYLMAKKIGHETWGNSDICYGPRLGFEVLLEYLVKTAFTFGQRKRYFQFIWATSLFHDYLNNPKLGDRLLLLTLQLLHQNDHLNQTVFILLSDHGIRWGGIRSTYQGKIEERMPLAYFVFPPWFHRKYPHLIKNLKLNSKRLTTPFDVHELLKDILYVRRRSPPTWEPPSQGKSHHAPSFSSLSSSSSSSSSIVTNSSNHINISPTRLPTSSSSILPRGFSLFQPIPSRRTCFDAEISDHWCVCNAMVSISKNTALVHSAALYIVDQINDMLHSLNEYCAKLELTKITEAFRTVEYNSAVSISPTTFEPPTTEADGTKFKTGSISGSHSSSTNNAIMNSQNPQNNKYQSNVGTNIYTDSSNNSDPVSNNLGGSGSSSNNKNNNIHTNNHGTTTNNRIQLQVTFITQPGDGIFEATVSGVISYGENHNYEWQLAGDISRISRYGSQSSCISNFILQKYCYCLEIEEDVS